MNNNINLTNIPVGKPVVIKRILNLKGYQSKLFEMGLFPGVKVEIIRGRRSGIYLLKVNENKLLLPVKIVEKIEI